MQLPEPRSGEHRKTAVKEITRSASAEKCPHGDDGWGEFVRSLDLLIGGEGAVKIVPPHPSHPIMRWLGANLEEKQEPRGASVAEAQNGDSMKSSGRNLTLAAIEKQSVAVDD